MRLLVDECVNKRIVERLRAAGHDVSWIAEIEPSNADDGILETSWRQSRIVLTADWDFGELAIREGRPAIGVVIIAMPSLHAMSRRLLSVWSRDWQSGISDWKVSSRSSSLGVYGSGVWRTMTTPDKGIR